MLARYRKDLGFAPARPWLPIPWQALPGGGVWRSEPQPSRDGAPGRLPWGMTVAQTVQAARATQDHAGPRMHRARLRSVTVIDRFGAYVRACEAEGLNAHNMHMWRIHGCPEGPV